MSNQGFEHIFELNLYAGREACESQNPQVFIELPHGATSMAELEYAKRFTRDYPGDRHDLFFMANTDQGSPEYGNYLAQLLTQQKYWQKGELSQKAMNTISHLRVAVMRCQIPRTILDVNRLWKRDAAAIESGLTPGTGPYIKNKDDLSALHDIYDFYQAEAADWYQKVCGQGGFGFNLHTYAPISVQPKDGEYVVDALWRAYRGGDYDLYPVRPEVELITAPEPGRFLSDRQLCDALLKQYQEMGLTVAENEPYPLHESTTAYEHAAKYPGRTLTIEISRKLLAKTFDPFTIMDMDHDQVDRLTRPIAKVFLESMKP